MFLIELLRQFKGDKDPLKNLQARLCTLTWVSLVAVRQRKTKNITGIRLSMSDVHASIFPPVIQNAQ